MPINYTQTYVFIGVQTLTQVLYKTDLKFEK